MFAISFIINALGNFSEKTGTKIVIDSGLIGTLFFFLLCLCFAGGTIYFCLTFQPSPTDKGGVGFALGFLAVLSGAASFAWHYNFVSEKRY